MIWILNKEQKTLVEQNHNLIYKFLADKKLSIDEYYGSAAEGLCRAAMIYDKTKEIKFSVIAYKCMWNICINEIKERGRFKRTSDRYTVSLNAYVDENKEYIDIIDISQNSINKFVFYEAILDFCCILTNRMRKVLNLKLNGVSDKEIALLLGVNRSTISRDLKSIRKLAKTELSNL